jgi:hypothetical protein
MFKIKKELRVGSVRDDAVERLAGYVRQRTDAMSQQYVGVLIDSAERQTCTTWLYHTTQLDLAELVGLLCELSRLPLTLSCRRFGSRRYDRVCARRWSLMAASA